MKKIKTLTTLLALCIYCYAQTNATLTWRKPVKKSLNFSSEIGAFITPSGPVKYGIARYVSRGGVATIIKEQYDTEGKYISSKEIELPEIRKAGVEPFAANYSDNKTFIWFIPILSKRKECRCSELKLMIAGCQKVIMYLSMSQITIQTNSWGFIFMNGLRI